MFGELDVGFEFEEYWGWLVLLRLILNREVVRHIFVQLAEVVLDVGDCCVLLRGIFLALEKLLIFLIFQVNLLFKFLDFLSHHFKLFLQVVVARAVSLTDE